MRNLNRQYDAFICYSRSDAAFARALERTLERYKPPKDLNAPQRHLDVFRDEGDLTGAEYYAAIDQHLEQSKKLIVICSPAARDSHYVNDEINRFVGKHSAKDVIPILLSGRPNNELGEDEQADAAFAPALINCMQVPLATSYVGFDAARERVNRGAYRSSWYTLLANLYDLSRREVEQRDRRRIQRGRRVRAGLGSALVVLLSGLTGWALLAQQRAERERLKVVMVNDFMENTLWDVDPMDGAGTSVRLIDALNHAAQINARAPGTDPEVRASIDNVLGWAYYRIGLLSEAEPFLVKALTERRRLLGPRHYDVAMSLHRLAQLRREQGDLQAADTLFAQARPLFRATPDADLGLAQSLKHHGVSVGRQGPKHYDRARNMLDSALVISRQQRNDTLTAELLNHIGVLMYENGRFDSADVFMQQALTRRQAALGPQHPQVLETLGNLAATREKMGDTKAAEATYRETIRLIALVSGDTAQELTDPMTNLALLLEGQGATEEASQLHARSLQLTRKWLGPDHPDVGGKLINYGTFLCTLGDARRAPEYLNDARRVFRLGGRDYGWLLANAEMWYGVCLGKIGRFAQGESHLQQGLCGLATSLGAEHARTVRALERAREFYQQWGKPAAQPTSPCAAVMLKARGPSP